MWIILRKLLVIHDFPRAFIHLLCQHLHLFLECIELLFFLFCFFKKDNP